MGTGHTVVDRRAGIGNRRKPCTQPRCSVQSRCYSAPFDTDQKRAGPHPHCRSRDRTRHRSAERGYGRHPRRHAGALRRSWPLYRFVGDKKAGDVTGENVVGRWSAVARTASHW
ncbi:hypothetical protein ACTMTJ_17280 [Phytohabitans sp. LJ34]|uniref:hypothetical protein n=1 Tax=Phytohabitans sp. LJ34 TaxID=3452217 RepID=UPI003F8CB2EF